MGIFDRFPYSSTHEMNLDFMLGKATEIAESLQEIDTHKEQAEQAAQAAQAAQTAAQAAQTAAQTSAGQAAQHKADAEDAADRAEAASDLADEAVEQAQTAAQNASTSATAAGTAAQNASTAADGAIASAAAAETRINNLAASLPEDFTEVTNEINSLNNAVYNNKNKLSNTPAALTFWRPSVDGFSENNKISPSDVPLNSYAVVLGSYLSNAFLTGDLKTIVSENTYWIIKLQSTYNSNLRMYILYGNADNAFYVGESKTATGNPYFINLHTNKPTISVAFFGDSITRGVNSDNATPGDQSQNTWTETNIPNLVAKELNCVIDNYGIGSIGWLNTGGATKGKAIDYLKRLGNSAWYWDGTGEYVNNKFIGTAKQWTSYNTILLSYGANDQAVGGNPTSLGSLNDIDDSMSDADIAAMTPTTIVEAMYQCYRYIIQQKPSINIIIVAPLVQKIGNAPDWSYTYRFRGGWNFYELIEMYEAFAKRYGLGFISNFDAPINHINMNYSLQDNVHPNTITYIQLSRHYAGKISALTF